jgi:hypothetical protein
MNDPDATALADLDRLGARAATALRERIDTVIQLDAPASGDDLGISTDLHAGGEPLVVDLDRRAAPDASSARRRRVLLAAAAIVVLVGVSAAIVLMRDERPAVTSGQPTYLLPSWLPEGLGREPEMVVLHDDSTTNAGLNGEIAVYGIESADDPWAGPTVGVAHIVPDPSSFGDESDGEQVTVGGHQATLSEDDRGWDVQWSEDGGRVLVRGVDMSRDEVLAAAAAASAEPAIALEGLPDGFAEIGRGPLDAVGTIGPFTGSGLSITYTSTAASSSEKSLVVAQRPGTAASVDLAGWGLNLDTGSTTVRGRHAAVGRWFTSETLLQWYEPSGTLVTLLASGLDEHAVRRVAEELRPAGDAEIGHLISEHPMDSPTLFGFGRLEEGQVAVVSGTMGEIRWRLVASVDQDAGLGSLSYEEAAAGSGYGAAVGSDDSGAAPALEATATETMDGESWAVYGVVAGDASAVTAEGADGSAVSLDLYEVTGWDRQVFIGFLPADAQARDVVAHRPDGTEIARQPLDLSLPTERLSGGDPTEECVEVGDGTVECRESAPTRMVEHDTIPAIG